MTQAQMRWAIRQMTEAQRQDALKDFEARLALARLLGRRVDERLMEFAVKLLRGEKTPNLYRIRVGGRCGRVHLVAA